MSNNGKFIESSQVHETCISPPAIPTGESAADILNMIIRKNNTFLDIGVRPLKAGWTVNYITTIATLLVCLPIIYLINWAAGLIITTIVILFIIFPAWRMFFNNLSTPFYPTLRFNRERREVYIHDIDEKSWIVPWETVHAFTPTATSASPFGVTQNGALIIWLPCKDEEHEPYNMGKTGQTLLFTPGPGHFALSQWECIRSFMEIGPQAIPESMEESLKLDSREYLKRGFASARRDFGWVVAALWYGCIGHILVNPLLGNWLIRKKLLPLPELPGDEVREWSKPLPREQWVKRSPELEQAITEREAELAERRAIEAKQKQV